MSNIYNDMAKEALWDKVLNMNPASVLDHVLKTTTWRNAPNAEEMIRDDSYKIALFEELWDNYGV